MKDGTLQQIQTLEEIPQENLQSINPEDFITSVSEEEINKEIQLTKFRNFVKENFFVSVFDNIDFSWFVKIISQIISFQLPEDYNEILITEKSAPFVWISNLAFLEKYEKEQKLGIKKFNGFNLELWNETVKLYIKWVNAKQLSEKNYYAHSTLSLIEKEVNTHQFIKYILAATIYLFDANLYSSEKSFENFDKAQELLNSSEIEVNIINEFNYYIFIFKGFVYLNNADYQKALELFELAKSLKQFPITAYFYSAMVLIKLDNKIDSLENIKNIIDYDLLRMNYAIENSNIKLFEFLLQNAVTYKIFLFDDFCSSLNALREFFGSITSANKEYLFQLEKQLEKLLSLKLQQYFTDEIKQEAEFLKKFIDTYKSKKNLFLFLIGGKVINYFNNFIDKIKNEVRNYSYKDIDKQLQYYDDQIIRLKNEAVNLEVNHKKLIEKLNQDYKKNIEIIEVRYNDEIEIQEKRLNNLDNMKQFNPGISFNNAMVYNIFISLIVFVIGGFIGLFLNESNYTQTLSEKIASIFMTGFTWGGIIFLLGILISVVSAVSTYFEKINERNRLIKKINSFKNQKERNITNTKKELENKINQIEKNKEEKKQEIEKNIIEMNEQKNNFEIELKNKAEEEIQKIYDEIDKALSSS
jgi:hypothetical protein